jgi:hypothetical protein
MMLDLKFFVVDGLPNVTLLEHLTLAFKVLTLYGILKPKMSPDFMTIFSGMQALNHPDVASLEYQQPIAALKRSLLELITTFKSSILQAKQVNHNKICRIAQPVFLLFAVWKWGFLDSDAV